MSRNSTTTSWSRVASRTVWLALIAAPLGFLLRNVLVDPKRRVVGQPSDPASYLWLLTESSESVRRIFGPFVSDAVAYPNGLTVPWQLRLPSLVVDAPVSLLAHFVDAPLAYNLMLIVFLGSAAVSFMRLCAVFNVSAESAALSFGVLALSPFFVTEMQLHLNLIAIAPLLELIRLLVLSNLRLSSFKWKAGFLLGLQFYIHPYFPVYAFLIAVVVSLARENRKRLSTLGGLKSLSGPCLIGIGLATPVLVGFWKLQTSSSRVGRSSDELNTYSLTFVQQVLTIPTPFIAVILGAISLLFFDKRLRKHLILPSALLLLGSILSLPRNFALWSWHVPSLSGVVFDVLGIHRVVGRAQVICWIGVAVVVSIACAHLTERWGAKYLFRTLLAVTLVWQSVSVGSISFFELRERPLLKDLLSSRDTLIADYPLTKFDAAIGPALLRQISHQGRLLNGGLPNTTNLNLILIAETSFYEESPESLQAIGLTDVISDTKASLPPSVRHTARKVDGIWHARVPPATGVARTWWNTSLGDEGNGFWLAGNASVTVSASSAGPYLVSFSLTSPQDANILSMSDSNQFSLSSHPTRVSICVETRGGFVGPALAEFQMTFSAPAVQLSPADARRAVARVEDVRVLPGCD